MSYTVVYWNRATADVYEVIRSQMPAEWRLVTLEGETKEAWRAQLRQADSGRWPWARLLHRVFAIQVLVCERCGGPRRILGAVTEPHAGRRLLAALGLAAEPPPGRPVTAA